MAKPVTDTKATDPYSALQERPKKRAPFSGDDNDPEGKSEENKKKREQAEREHKHK